MKKQILFLVFSFILKFSVGQNLVPNGDFEQYWGCPSGLSEIDSAKFWIQPTIYGTADYFNQCAFVGYANVPHTNYGFQPAHSGVAYAGIELFISSLNDFREYIEVPFNSVEGSSLIANTCYHFEMYINLANINRYTCHNVGVYFSNTLISGLNTSLILPFTPQIVNLPINTPDTLNWTLVSGNYTAQGGESYLIIGNFDDNLSTDTINVDPSGLTQSYIYIDDVSLVPCSSVGITNYNNAPPITIYPNPAVDFITITTNAQEETLLFTDVLGRDIGSLKTTAFSKTNVDISHFPNVFFVKSNGGVQKVVRQ